MALVCNRPAMVSRSLPACSRLWAEEDLRDFPLACSRSSEEVDSPPACSKSKKATCIDDNCTLKSL